MQVVYTSSSLVTAFFLIMTQETTWKCIWTYALHKRQIVISKPFSFWWRKAKHEGGYLEIINFIWAHLNTFLEEVKYHRWPKGYIYIWLWFTYFPPYIEISSKVDCGPKKKLQRKMKWPIIPYFLNFLEGDTNKKVSHRFNFQQS